MIHFVVIEITSHACESQFVVIEMKSLLMRARVFAGASMELNQAQDNAHTILRWRSDSFITVRLICM